MSIKIARWCVGFTLRSSVHDHFWDHPSQKKPEKAESKAETCPVVPILHSVQWIAVEVNHAIEVHFVECLHGNLASSAIQSTCLWFMKCEVALHGLSGVPHFLILARGDARCYTPEGDQDRDQCKQRKATPEYDASSGFDIEIGGDDYEECEEE